MKLYEATVEVTLYVVAENEDEAHGIAERCMSEESSHADIFLNNNPKNICSDWVDSLPYGQHQNKTVRQWREELLKVKDSQQKRSYDVQV